MTKRKHTIDSAQIALSKKGVRFDDSRDVIPAIDISKAKQLGNKSWGKIDFLEKYGFVVVGMSNYRKQF